QVPVLRRGRSAALGQERRPLSERTEQVPEFPTVACGHVEGEKGGGCLCGRGDARLMLAEERDAVCAVFGCDLVEVVLVAGALAVGRAHRHQVRGRRRCGTTEHTLKKERRG